MTGDAPFRRWVLQTYTTPASGWNVMAGLVRPSTSSLVHAPKTWMPATSAGMTPENVMVTPKTNPFVPAQAGTQTQNTLDPRLRENKRRLATPRASAYASARWRFDCYAASEVMVENVSSVRRLASAIEFDAL